MWQLYCSVYPHMSAENFKNFEEFKDYLTGTPQKNSSKEEILGKVEGILNNIRWKETKI